MQETNVEYMLTLNDAQNFKVLQEKIRPYELSLKFEVSLI